MKKVSFLLTLAAVSAVMLGCNDYLCLAPPGTTASSKLAVCHVTGKPGKYELLSVKASAAQAHADHGDFLAPAGAKKASDCVPPVVIPPVVIPPIGPVTIPPVVVPPVVVPPVVIPPVVIPPVVIPPVVIPPVVIPPVVVPPADTTTPPPADEGDGSKVTDDKTDPCLFDASNPACAL